jgi:hypothetical protein
MSCFAPCPACNRHVATDETACPFCSAALPDSIRCQPRRRPHARLSRAAMLAAGAALIAAEAACGSVAVPVYGGPGPAGAGGGSGGAGGARADAGTAQAPAEQAPPDQGEREE